MSDIATKLTYLDTTREKILTETNRLGVGLTEQDKFRDYAKGLHDGYVDILNNGTDTLYDNMEKVSGSGSDITLENTEEAPMRSELEGDTYQETTTGKNLFNKSVNPSSQAGTTTTELDTGIRATVTSTGQNKYTAINLPNPSYLLGKTVTISANISISGTNNALIRVFWLNGNTLTGMIANTIATTGSYTFDIPSSFPTNNNGIAIVFNSNASMSTSQVGDYVDYTNVQLEIGSTVTPYEEYTGGQPSPNPDYTQPINVVTGRQTITTCGKNLFDYNLFDTFTTTIKYVSLTLKPNTQYTMSSNIPITSGVGTNLFFMINGETASTTNNGVRPETPRTLTTDSTGIVKIGYRTGTGVSANPKTDYWYQIEEGTATTYEAYTGITNEINLGKNLYNSEIELGTINTSTGVNENATNCVRSKDYVAVQQNTTYTISNNKNYQEVMYFYGSDKSFKRAVSGSAGNYTFTTRSDEYYVRNRTSQGSNQNDTSVLFQLEKGSSASSFSSYKTPIELCKINDYKDRIYKNNGTWYIEKQISKVVLNGSENWAINKDKTYVYQFYFNHFANDLNLSDSEIKSNYFKYQTGDPTDRTNENYIWVYRKALLIDIQKSIIPSLADFKTWLSTNNVSVYYPLETPTTTEITDTELLTQLNNWYNQKSIEGQTNISVTSEDLPAILNVIAIKKYE